MRKKIVRRCMPCAIQLCGDPAIDRSLYCQWHSTICWFVRTLVVLAFIVGGLVILWGILGLQGCAAFPRPTYGEWETWRIAGGVEDLECRRVGVDPVWLQCAVPGQRRPLP